MTECFVYNPCVFYTTNHNTNNNNTMTNCCESIYCKT